MRYSYRLVFVDGQAAGVLLDKGNRLVTMYTHRDYFIDMHRAELQPVGNILDATPAWIDPDVHAAGVVTLGEVESSDDIPEIFDDLSPASYVAWRSFRLWATQRVDAERACTKKGFALFHLRVSGLLQAFWRISAKKMPVLIPGSGRDGRPGK